ncbi:Druantia anti-phage system protein DruA [Puia sp. P3]|uniref:Druantia anti-phage system protein DruA n=1 Tax=Puia sp. P3 TaxID=3423952 RepID=UPI003D671C75
MKKPTKEKIERLRKLALIYKQKHLNNPHSAKFTSGNEDLSWKERAESFLFKSKRATLLAELMTIRAVFNKYAFSGHNKRELETCLEMKDFREAVQKLVRKVKSIHVGINMMDIIICGSVAPYNHILGGKLVCMLLTSPEITQYYNKKYRDAISLIASSMSGKAVNRKPNLVLLGTTSLYGIGSSQYNRIKIPAETIDGLKGSFIEYKELGFSEGYGSFHFSNDTIVIADAVVGREKGRSRVNSIFGEGANPLIRKLKDAFEYLKLDSGPILKHRNQRVVYGIALAENFGDILLGLAERPKYFVPQSNSEEKSRLLSNYWIKRWLSKRVLSDEILQKVSEHTLSYPISHGARVVSNDPEEVSGTMLIQFNDK